MANLEVVIRCKECKAEIDRADLAAPDPATHLCEMAGDLNLEHDCSIIKADGDDDDDEDALRD